jgi:hypothetical protein
MAGDDDLCQICYTNDLSPENAMIICWNSHVICGDCCNSIYNSGRSIKCPFDRGLMFDWRKPDPTGDNRQRRNNPYVSRELARQAAAAARRAAAAARVAGGVADHRPPQGNIRWDELVPHRASPFSPSIKVRYFNNTMNDVKFGRMCSLCGCGGHDVRSCVFKDMGIDNHPEWARINRNRINHLKDRIKFRVENMPEDVQVIIHLATELYMMYHFRGVELKRWYNEMYMASCNEEVRLQMHMSRVDVSLVRFLPVSYWENGFNRHLGRPVDIE